MRNPGPGNGIQIEGTILHAELGVRLLNIDSGGKNLVMQRQRGFDQSGRPGGRLGVADLGFHTSQSTPLLILTRLGINAFESLKLHHVAHLGAGSVSFHHLDSTG